MRNRMQTRCGCLALVCLTLLLAGCRPKKLETSYGNSTGYAGRESINGFGGLRTLYEEVGWRTRSISRLNERARRLDAIVWIPDVPTGIQSDATEWFEAWMQAGGKTLVYVTYDGVSDAAYWRQAAQHATPQQRLEYRRRLANAQFEQFARQLRLEVPESNGWVQWQRLSNPRPVRTEKIQTAAAAPSSEETRRASAEDEGARNDQSLGSLGLDAPLSVRVEVSDVAGSNESDNGNQTAGGTGQAAGPVLPWNIPLHTVDEKSDTDVRVRPAVSLASGVPLITEVTSAEWGDSKVMIVAGGSLFSNFAFTTESGRMLASNLVADSGEAAQVGFLHTSVSPLSVDESDGSTAARTGMELLVVWPISLITMHGALLGIVIVLILMPVFGRPRRIKQPSQTDFADHLDAVAGWMERAPNDHYARQKISEYMQRVRGETSGKWILPEHGDEPQTQDNRAGE